MNSDPKKTVLVVDDTPENLNVVKGVLVPTYRVIAAVNGLLALKLAEKQAPDLILLDVMMPDMDGFEVCRRLKANPQTADIPVIFLTAKNEIEDETSGFDLGAVDYITKPISPPTLIRRVATHLSLVRAQAVTELAHAAIRMLGEAGHYNDTDTGNHIWRMAAYSSELALAAGWPEDRAEQLELAAPMHDTGKIGLPDSILKAPRPLEPMEWEVMKTHAKIGHEILGMSSNPVFQLAADIALSHHEKWDGSGYPQGLVGKEIPESARIVAIADVFDALTTKRPYKEAWSVEKAMAEIQRGSGHHFDPELAELFVSIEPRIREIQKEWSQ